MQNWLIVALVILIILAYTCRPEKIPLFEGFTSVCPLTTVDSYDQGGSTLCEHQCLPSANPRDASTCFDWWPTVPRTFQRYPPRNEWLDLEFP